MLFIGPCRVNCLTLVGRPEKHYLGARYPCKLKQDKTEIKVRRYIKLFQSYFQTNMRIRVELESKYHRTFVYVLSCSNMNIELQDEVSRQKFYSLLLKIVGWLQFLLLNFN